MIALILTLFISLFSICPSVNTIEDQYENNTYYHKEAIEVGNSVLLWTYNDFTNEDKLRLLVSKVHELTETDISENFNYSISTNPSSCYSSNLTTFMSTLDVPPISNTGVDTISFILYTDSISGFKELDIILDLNETLRYRFDIWYNYTDLTSYYSATGSFSIPKFNIIRTKYEVFNTSPSLTDREFMLFVNSVGNEDLFNLFQYANTSANYNYDLGFQEGLQQGFTDGFQTGYTQGYNEGVNIDDTASTIFTGILDVALVPVNVFLSIFNFEVFGINIGGIVSGLLTLSVVIIILRFLFGGKKDD